MNGRRVPAHPARPGPLPRARLRLRQRRLGFAFLRSNPFAYKMLLLSYVLPLFPKRLS